MATCTIFKNFTVPVENKSLLLIAKDIQSDKYKTQVEEIRLLEQQGKSEEAQNKKSYFQPSHHQQHLVRKGNCLFSQCTVALYI